MPQYFDELVIILRKVHIMYQAYRWGRLARKSLHNFEFRAAEIAMAKFDQLNNMLNND